MWGLAHESHHHTRVWGVSGHHVNHLGPCGNIVHSCIHSMVLIALPRVSTWYCNPSVLQASPCISITYIHQRVYTEYSALGLEATVRFFSLFSRGDRKKSSALRRPGQLTEICKVTKRKILCHISTLPAPIGKSYSIATITTRLYKIL